MANLKHKYFKNHVEGIVQYKAPTRFMSDVKSDEEKDYRKQAVTFEKCIEDYFINKSIRDSKRSLNVSKHIDYAELIFFNTYDRRNFENKYIADFGMSPVFYTELDKRVLFAVENPELFNNFIDELNKFINTDDHTNPQYNPNIKFIKSFTFYGSDRILSLTHLPEQVSLNLIDDNAIYTDFSKIFDDLKVFLSQYRDIGVLESESYIELYNADYTLLNIIADNFDIIYSITATNSGIVRPGLFNTPTKSFGFAVSTPDDNLPIIGVIDSGVSNNNPLSEIIINDNDFDITGTGALVDNINHGTGVACIAALGNKPYSDDFSGAYKPDARILPIKIIDSNSSVLSEFQIIEKIKLAHSKYNVRIFTLTVGYNENLKTNQKISEYAYKLDKLAYELDILIIIATTNTNDIEDSDYPVRFNRDMHNFSSPAESMNNITVGSIADNLEQKVNSQQFSIKKHYPAYYTRLLHIDFGLNDFTKNQRNKSLVKPDVLAPGGDGQKIISNSGFDIFESGDCPAGLKVISSKEGEFFMKTSGTSLSVPFVANLAIQIIRNYPRIRAESIKALIINSTDKVKLGKRFDTIPNYRKLNLKSRGIINFKQSLYSNENEISMILEDSIDIGKIKAYPINLPEYLLNMNTDKKLLRITATLCFKFEPFYKSQISYCPIHITFGVFKNLPIESDVNTGLNNNKAENIKLKDDAKFCEDYYYKNKILSNTHKISFVISKTELLNEDNTFKLAIKSCYHKYLTQTEKSLIPNSNTFSIVMKIEEIPIKGQLTGRLYNEIDLINELENIIDVDLEAELNN